MSDQGHPGDRSLSEIAEHDRRLAEAAAHDAEVERPVAAGRPDHPHPDIAAADQVRAEDDVRTFQRQETIADQQAQAAETMEDNQRLLFENAQRITGIHDDVHQRTGEVEALAADADELREQTREVAEQARDIEPPEV
jgi:small-conductance mechanosensitive channel